MLFLFLAMPSIKKTPSFFRVISNVISLSMGEKWPRNRGGNGGVHAAVNAKLNQAITIGLVHDALVTGLVDPKCAYWDIDSHRWATAGCRLLSTNGTFSLCGCQRLATFALLAPRGLSKAPRNDDIFVGIMAAIAFILVLGLVVVIVVCCYCKRRKVYSLSR
jgi:hypothetical protein